MSRRGRVPVPLNERAKKYFSPSGDGCWEWTGGKDRRGYGQIGECGVGGRTLRAHRVVYEMMVGPIPAGMELCHRCDNPGCVRPDHMFIGTHWDNMQDRNRKGRVKKPDNRGENNGRALLTVSDVKRVRFVLSLGYNQCQVARFFEVNRTTIRSIAIGRNWKCLEAA